MNVFQPRAFSTNMIGYIILTLRIEREDTQWTAECVELGTATHADSLEAASTEIRELIGLHLEALEEMGERDRFFLEHGIAVRPVPLVPTKRDVTFGGGIFPEIFPVEYGAVQYA
jgi:predicted RNase H-like HicB family nuclease